MLSIPLHSTLLKPPHQLSTFSVHNVSNWLFSFSKKTPLNISNLRKEFFHLFSLFPLHSRRVFTKYRYFLYTYLTQVSQSSAAWLSTPLPWNWSCQVNNGLVDPISLGLLGTFDTLTIPWVPCLYSLPVFLYYSRLSFFPPQALLKQDIPRRSTLAFFSSFSYSMGDHIHPYGINYQCTYDFHGSFSP